MLITGVEFDSLWSTCKAVTEPALLAKEFAIDGLSVPPHGAVGVLARALEFSTREESSDG